ncbi:hypothetical protein JK358_22695 [Nocardia sp. 2]|uniref:Schlafen AlbA-2 domain-containing protein n=1 Tax=Nocardia acididurans TaxID=2802282 RepID=A0ABS1M984_9NOCA|nr:hypothetical protein [Nocardia acididurans]MBL1077212.1 hypothetical protein [Nocardia acididurans]
MNKVRTEIRVNDIVNHVIAGGKVEDDYVEAKSQWPKPEKARQLAAMANAAGGQPILWLIGLSEDRHLVVPLDSTDPATWWAQVRSRFAHDVCPDLSVLNVPTDHGRVVCLQFETDRAPYLVKTPGGTATSEVPWRSGTSTRTATRNELLSLLKSATSVPELELLDGGANLQRRVHPRGPDELPDVEFTLRFAMHVYIDSEPGRQLLLPRHRWSMTVATPSGLDFTPRRFRISCEDDAASSTSPGGRTHQPYPLGATARSSGLYVHGADVVEITASKRFSRDEAAVLTVEPWLDIDLHLPLGTSDRAARVSERFNAYRGTGTNSGMVAWWDATID